MDDVLKSRAVDQTGGDGVSAVRYESSDPLEKRLAVFPFRVGSGLSSSRILDQFKGAELKIDPARETIHGTIASARAFSCAVDLGSRITTAYDPSSKLQSEFRIRRGSMTTKTAAPRLGRHWTSSGSSSTT